MANTKLKHVDEIISMESISIGTTAQVLSAVATIPGNTGEIVCYPNIAMHWTPQGTATSTFAHAVAATETFRLAPNQHGASIISDTTTAVTLLVAYIRGSRRSDGKHAVSRPY